MPLRLYNTLTQTKEPFQTVEPGKVGMYVCGPTVYSNSHIGHMVGPVIFDTIKRYLVYLGYEVTWVVNITDVDDKLIVQAEKDGTTVKDLADRVTEDYLHCLEALGVDGIDHMPRATEHIAEIVAMTQGLIDKGFAYPSGGDVYFDVTKAPEYGKLSHRDPEALQAGARIEPSSIKRHPGDFALWKGSKPGEPAWESPWGPGRPGWHIECSAMSMKLLGEHFDIHGGGLDLVFPHHENEVVQSESLQRQAVRHLLAAQRPADQGRQEDLQVRPRHRDPDGRPAPRSRPRHPPLPVPVEPLPPADRLRARPARRAGPGPGGVLEPVRPLRAADRRELLRPRSPERSTSHDRARRSVLAEVAEHRTRFLEAMDDDFNTGGALGELYELVRALNRFADAQKLEPSSDPHLLAAVPTRDGRCSRS